VSAATARDVVHILFEAVLHFGGVKRRAIVAIVMFAVGGSLVASSLAIGDGGSRERAGLTSVERGGTLRLARFKDVDYVDPALAYTSWSWPFLFATCAKLFNYPDKEGSAGARVIPEVVHKSVVSSGGRTYTFDLNRSFRFHNGHRVTARSFADAFNRDANPMLNSPAQQYMHEIVGADAVIAGTATTISGVRVLGRYRLRIRLTKPLGDFVARLTLPFFCPVLPNTPIDPAGIDDPPGSGPYYVAERIVNNRIVLKRNPFYRGSRPANVDQITYTIKSQEACLRAIELDEIDHCLGPGGLPLDSYEELAKRYGVNRKGGRFFVKPTLLTWYFSFNHDRRAFKGRVQIPLEKAINYAIDRPALVRAFGGGRRTDQMLPPALRREESLYPLDGADPRRALRWLRKARYKPRRLVLYWNNGASEAADIFKFDLKQIGIDVDVKLFTTSVLFDKLGTRGEPFDVGFGGWNADYADGAAFFVPLASGTRLRKTGNNNTSYFNDPTANATIKAAERKRGKTRRKAWADLDVDLMRNNPPWAPFVHTLARDFVSASFGCFLFHPVYWVDLAVACKKRE
jgi:ABC-type oligopeptide transport system substrate-binding subunit